MSYNNYAYIPDVSAGEAQAVVPQIAEMALQHLNTFSRDAQFVDYYFGDLAQNNYQNQYYHDLIQSCIDVCEMTGSYTNNYNLNQDVQRVVSMKAGNHATQNRRIYNSVNDYDVPIDRLCLTAV